MAREIRCSPGTDEDWPISRFLELLRIWADFDPPQPLSWQGIKPHVDAAAALLRLPQDHAASFQDTIDGVPLTPVPLAFYGNPRQVGVAVLGLNPRATDPWTTDEKRITRELSPTAYARFYTTDRSLPQALTGAYYRNLATMLLSLEPGRLVKFSDYCHNRYLDRTAAFASIVAPAGLLEMRLVPFYSRSWRPAGPRGLAQLLDHPRYGQYYSRLVDLVEEVLQPEGWLIANGRDPATLLPRLLAARAPLVPVGPRDPGRPYAFYRWRQWRIVLLQQFLRSRGGKLNSNQDLALLFTAIGQAFRP